MNHREAMSYLDINNGSQAGSKKQRVNFSGLDEVLIPLSSVGGKSNLSNSQDGLSST